MNVLLDNRVMGNAGAYADGGLAISKRIPSETHSRIKVMPSGIDARLARKPRIAGISESRRTAGNDGAPLACVKSGQAEVVKVSLLKGQSKKGIPIQAIGDGQLGTDLPGILCVQRKKILAHVHGIGIGLAELRNAAQQEIRQAQTRGVPESEVAGRKGVPDLVLDGSRKESAEGELM